MIDVLDDTSTHASFDSVSLQRKALSAVANLRLPVKDPLSVVWFCKTLQNWKAVVTPLPPDGHIYEVTYDGDKKRTYVDTYVKKYNDTIPDMEVAIND